MKYAYITDGIVSEVVQSNPRQLFGASYASKFIEVPDEVQQGWIESAGIYSAPPVPEPTPEQLREAAKAAREIAVANIKVTTQAGNIFDGDEVSQGRMSRAIIALSTGLAPSVNWALADNSVIQATAAELTEALVLSGQAQAAIWVIPQT